MVWRAIDMQDVRRLRQATGGLGRISVVLSLILSYEEMVLRTRSLMPTEEQTTTNGGNRL